MFPCAMRKTGTMPTLELNEDHHVGRGPDAAQPSAVHFRPARPHPVWWVIAVSLAVIAVSMVLRVDGVDGGVSRPAFAQSTVSAGAHGVFAFSGQVSKNAYGVFMVDVDAGTIWCYRFDQGGDKLKLVAGRDWRFDRKLENWGTEPPTTVIQQILNEQLAAKQKASGTP
jgi:hypothetical protein